MPMMCRESACVCCPSPNCGGRLSLFQPHEHRPARLLGVCEDCESVVVIGDTADGSAWSIRRLVPEAIAAAAG